METTVKKKKLSSRESATLDLIIGGNKNKAIAEKLGINEKTVSTYKARLMKKLELKSDDTVINVKQAAQAKGYIEKTDFTLAEVIKALNDGVDFGLECAGICTGKKQSDFVTSWLEDNA